MQSLLPISSLYVPFFGLMFVVITMRVGNYRRENQLPFGEGGDKKFLALVRAQANFTESVPIAVVILVLLELAGQSASMMHGLFVALILGRTLHYLQLTGVFNAVLIRILGMLLTLGPILVASIALALRAV